MEFILILTLIGVVAFGYLTISRIDKFLNSGGFADNRSTTPEPAVVVFSKPAETKTYLGPIMECLIRGKVPVQVISEPHLPERMPVKSVLALSDSDVDNLLLCHESHRRSPDIYCVARCSSAVFPKTFRDAGVDCVLSGVPSADRVLCHCKVGFKRIRQANRLLAMVDLK